MGESQESQKKVDDGLYAMCQENLGLSKELTMSLQEGFFVGDGAFLECFEASGIFLSD